MGGNGIVFFVMTQGFQELEQRYGMFGSQVPTETGNRVHAVVRKARITLVEYTLLTAMLLATTETEDVNQRVANTHSAVQTTKGTSQNLLNDGQSKTKAQKTDKEDKPSKSRLTIDDVHPFLWQGSLKILRNQPLE